MDHSIEDDGIEDDEIRRVERVLRRMRTDTEEKAYELPIHILQSTLKELMGRYAHSCV